MLDEYISRVVMAIMALVHGVFSGWVNVSSVAGNDGQIGMSVTSQGQTLFENVAVLNVNLARLAADLLSVINAVGL